MIALSSTGKAGHELARRNHRRFAVAEHEPEDIGQSAPMGKAGGDNDAREVIGTIVSDPNNWAFKLMPAALNEVFGKENWRSEKIPSKTKPEKLVTYIWVS